MCIMRGIIAAVAATHAQTEGYAGTDLKMRSVTNKYTWRDKQKHTQRRRWIYIYTINTRVWLHLHAPACTQTPAHTYEHELSSPTVQKNLLFEPAGFSFIYHYNTILSNNFIKIYLKVFKNVFFIFIVMFAHCKRQRIWT